MKISKVNHTKSGVGIKEEHSKGMLYYNPQKESSNSINLSSHVQNLNRQAQTLYSIFIFNSIKPNEMNNLKIDKDFKTMFKDMETNVLKKYNEKYSIDKNIGYQVSQLDKFLQSNKSKKNIRMNEEEIQTVINQCLRNSLRKEAQTPSSEKKYYFPDIMKKMLKYIAVDGAEELTLSEKKAFLFLLDADYSKSKEIKEIVNSIELQNVRVKTEDRNGNIYLKLSGADHPKKKYIFKFLCDFAECNSEKDREKLLVHFKQLILLFYCGQDKYDEVLSVPESLFAWSWGIHKEEDFVNFDDEVYQLINERQLINEKLSIINEQLINEEQDIIKKQLRNEKQENKSKIRPLDDEIKQKLKKNIASKYRNAIAYHGITEEDVFWIEYIEKSAEKILLNKNNINPIRLSVSYLCDHTYKEWVSYICLKFIDMGKGVYHFATPEVEKILNGENIIGEVLPEYTHGITSFDYEKIKAEETLNREISVYMTFAVDNFARSVVPNEVRNKSGQEDVLQFDDNALEERMYKNHNNESDVVWRLMRFFGGMSGWENKDDIKDVKSFELAKQIKIELNKIRNSSFHYTAEENYNTGDDENIIRAMFEKEYNDTGLYYRKKYFSNNTLLFYTNSDITKLMDALYNEPKERKAQIPAFGRVVKKSKVEEFIKSYIMGKKLKKLYSGENNLERMEKFRSSLYFILKEIYYYGFLQDASVKKLFMDIVKEDTNLKNSNGNIKRPYDIKNKDALKDFYNRLIEIDKSASNITFSEMCQQIMTDYNQQNQNIHTVVSGNKSHDNEKYKHFRMLLYMYIQEAFKKYLKSEENKEIYGFLRNPEERQSSTASITLEEFCYGWQPHTFDILKKDINDDSGSMLLSWYTAAHFLNPKQLNLLSGSIRSYIQFIEDIARRSQDSGNNMILDTEKIKKYNKILSVLDFVILSCGSTTNCIKDYFIDDEDYASYLAHYVDFAQNGDTSSTALKIFCQKPAKSVDGNIGLYYDEKNPIMNKNIVYASMYGNEHLFSKCFEKIKEEYIRTYYKDKKELESVFSKGHSDNFKEEKQLRDFQTEKNHIELTEITTYSEIVSDFMGQLVSWAYLRERDLMYFQLGFYYVKLYYGTSIENDSFLRCLEGENISIKNSAVLYQILAMYTYHWDIFGKNDKEGKGAKSLNKSSTGNRVASFYKEYCKDKGEIYEAGLCLFEDIKNDHDDLVHFRNYIDHFKYYSKADRSIMELYSDVYDRFLDYDIKLKKSVSYIFKNILLKYFVIPKTAMSYEDRKRYFKNLTKKYATKIYIEKDLNSEEFKLPVNIVDNKKDKDGKKEQKKNKKGKIFARNDIFLQQLRNILEYKK